MTPRSRERPLARRRGPGLRVRLTLLATGLAAAVSGLLLWLGWMLVGQVAASVPALPPEMPVTVDGVQVPAGRIAEALGASARSEVLHVGAVASALVVLAAAIASWVLAGSVLRPVHQVTATARRLSAASLDDRIDLAGPRDEVAELADTFDAMLDRLQAAFDAQRRFVANASHELRTPLAVLRTEVDVTLADPDADTTELRRMGSVVRDATRRAEDLVAGLLLLARTESGDPSERGEDEPVDLVAAVHTAVAAVRGEVTARGLQVDVDPPAGAGHGLVPPAPVPSALGDVALLERVVGNLVENAVRHNVDGGWIRAGVGPAADGRVELTVASSGPVVDPEQVPTLFEPFRRGAGRVSGPRSGAGLGLSIVRAVVEAHGGTVSARPVPGGGLSVTVRLPAATDAAADGAPDAGLPADLRSGAATTGVAAGQSGASPRA